MRIRVTKDEVVVEDKTTKIHKGEYNANEIEFSFTEDYDNLIKKAIFENEKDKIEVSIKNNKCNIPMQILQGKSNTFNLRVYGYQEVNNEVSIRFSPSYATIPLFSGSYIGNTTIIPSSSGEANLQTKSINITQNGTQVVEPDAGYDGLESVEIETNVPSSGSNIEESKSVEYTENGEYSILPDTGYDGIEGANVTVNVPTLSTQVKYNSDITSNGAVTIQPDNGYDAMTEVNFYVSVPSEINNETQTHTITENGSYVYTPTSAEYTGMDSVSVDVNVPSSGGAIDLTSGVKFAYSSFSSIPNDILNANWEDITEMDNMFEYNIWLQTVPNIGTTGIVSMQYTFANCNSLETVNTNNTANVIYMTSIFENDSMLQNVPQLDTSSCIGMQNAFLGCSSLTNESLNNILEMCANVDANYTRPKALKDIGLDDTQIATCQTLSNYQDMLDAGWTDYIEVTADVDLTTIRSLAGTSNLYTVPTLGAFDMYLYNYNVICTLNDSTLQEQVTGIIEWNHFESTDGTLSFDINYNDTGSGNEYYFENISYNPQS